MIRIVNGPVFAVQQASDAVLELIEADVEVSRVASGRVQPQPGRAKCGGGHHSQLREADQRGLLGEFVVASRAAKTEMP